MKIRKIDRSVNVGKSTEIRASDSDAKISLKFRSGHWVNEKGSGEGGILSGTRSE